MFRGSNLPYRLNKLNTPNRAWYKHRGWLALPVVIALVVVLEVWAFLNVVTWAIEIGMKLFEGG